MYIDDDEFYLNPFLVADKGYTTETAPYRALSDYQGSKIPRFYESYSLDIPLEPTDDKPTEDKRSVRLILVGFIPGLSMLETEPCDFSQKARQNILKTLIEFESSVYARNIILDDLHPRNVMITNPGNEAPHIILIDFGDVCFGRLGYDSDDPDLSEWFPGTYIPPLLRWHEIQRKVYGFRDWIDWDWQQWLEEEFAHTEVTIKPGMRGRFLP